MPIIERIDNDDQTTTLSVKISKEELTPTIEKELKKLRQNVAMKGFRPGQTPMPLVKKFYGNRLLLETVNEMTISELEKFIQENEIETLLQPIPSEKPGSKRFEINQLEDYTFHFDIARQPIFDIKGLSKSDTYERLVPSDLAELVAEDIKYARRRLGERTHPTGDIQEEDVVKIAAVELNPDGTKKAGGIETTMSCFVPNISSQAFKTFILSKKTGDTFQFNPRDLDTWKEEKLFRKYMLNLENENDTREVSDLFEGTVEEVSRLIVADVDQAFYDKYFGEGVVKSDEEAQEKFGENIKRHFGTQADALLLRDMQSKLLLLNPIPLPTEFIKRYLMMNQEEGSKTTAADIEAAMPGLLKSFRWDLIRGKISREADIQVTQAELKAAFMGRVRGYFQGQNMNLPDTFFESTAERLMEDKEQRQDVHESILYDKLFAEMASRVTLVDLPIHSSEITAQIEAANQQAKLNREESELID